MQVHQKSQGTWEIVTLSKDLQPSSNVFLFLYELLKNVNNLTLYSNIFYVDGDILPKLK